MSVFESISQSASQSVRLYVCILITKNMILSKLPITSFLWGGILFMFERVLLVIYIGHDHKSWAIRSKGYALTLINSQQCVRRLNMGSRSQCRTAASGTVPSGAFMWAVKLKGWGAKISDHRCGVFADWHNTVLQYSLPAVFNAF